MLTFIRKQLRKLIVWALTAEQYKHDPRDLDNAARN